MKQSHKTLLLWVLLIVMFLAIWQVLQPGERKQQVSFSQFVALVHSGAGHRRPHQGPRVHVHADPGRQEPRRRRRSAPSPTKRFSTTSEEGSSPPDHTPNDKLQIFFEKEDATPFWSSTLVTLLPMLFIGVMFFLFMRQLQAGGGKAMSFGKAKARMLSDSQNKVTFADVAGIDEAKDEVEEIIAFLKDPKKFQRLGGRIPKGVLLIGPPGTGKTLLARAIAGEAGVPFFSISGSDFVEMFVGVGASRVRDLFEQGKKHAPCIIFIDEIDAVGRHRGAGLGGGHDEREQTLNQLLVEMDGFESNEGVIIIAATNRPDVLDPAILRPGRFDRRITGPRPDVRGREEILRVHAKRDAALARRRPRRSSRAARPASRAPTSRTWSTRRPFSPRVRTRTPSDMVDFELAKDKVYMGTERRSMVISDEEKRTTAVHEAGHTLISVLINHHDPVHKVTIIPRGPALGVTWYLPKDDRHNLSRGAGESSIAWPSAGGLPRRSSSGDDDGRRQRHREGDRDRAQDGVRVGHEREARTARLREKGGGDLPRPRLWPALAGLFGADSSGDRPGSARHRPAAIRAREGISHCEGRDKLQTAGHRLIERETLDAEEIAAVLEGRELPKRDGSSFRPTPRRTRQAKRSGGSRDLRRRTAEARATGS